LKAIESDDILSKIEFFGFLGIVARSVENEVSRVENFLYKDVDLAVSDFQFLE
jgi:hypothetical protein